mmetsp:Transcript_95985/g.268667  ORF Transcript_95985/g.268667 Transcript_95985/m.268667 type:complete len:269 (-) Transcript_95985:127-933(-)
MRRRATTKAAWRSGRLQPKTRSAWSSATCWTKASRPKRRMRRRSEGKTGTRLPLRGRRQSVDLLLEGGSGSSSRRRGSSSRLRRAATRQRLRRRTSRCRCSPTTRAAFRCTAGGACWVQAMEPRAMQPRATWTTSRTGIHRGEAIGRQWEISPSPGAASTRPGRLGAAPSTTTAAAASEATAPTGAPSTASRRGTRSKAAASLAASPSAATATATRARRSRTVLRRVRSDAGAAATLPRSPSASPTGSATGTSRRSAPVSARREASCA